MCSIDFVNSLQTVGIFVDFVLCYNVYHWKNANQEVLNNSVDDIETAKTDVTSTAKGSKRKIIQEDSPVKSATVPVTANDSSSAENNLNEEQNDKDNQASIKSTIP